MDVARVNFCFKHFGGEKILFYFCAILCLGGCATTETRDLEFYQPVRGKSAIIVIRPNKFLASMGGPLIVLDAESKGVLWNGGFLKFEVSPGAHTLETRHNDKWWAGKEDRLEFLAQEGASYYYRIFPKAVIVESPHSVLFPYMLATDFKIAAISADELSRARSP